MLLLFSSYLACQSILKVVGHLLLANNKWLHFDQIYVFYPEEAKVGVKTMKTYTNRMKSENVFRAILVVQQSLTPFARSCQAEISSKFQLEVFQVMTIYSAGEQIITRSLCMHVFYISHTCHCCLALRVLYLFI